MLTCSCWKRALVCWIQAGFSLSKTDIFTWIICACVCLYSCVCGVQERNPWASYPHLCLGVEPTQAVLAVINTSITHQTSKPCVHSSLKKFPLLYDIKDIFRAAYSFEQFWKHFSRTLTEWTQSKFVVEVELERVKLKRYWFASEYNYKQLSLCKCILINLVPLGKISNPLASLDHFHILYLTIPCLCTICYSIDAILSMLTSLVASRFGVYPWWIHALKGERVFACICLRKMISYFWSS